MKFEAAMKRAMAAASIILAGAVLGACATHGSAGGASGGYKTFMQKCMEKAGTEQQRSECAWENAARMASGK